MAIMTKIALLGKVKLFFQTRAAISLNLYYFILCILYNLVLAAGYRSDCDDVVTQTAIYDAAPDTCPALDWSCVNKADALIAKYNATTACTAQKAACKYTQIWVYQYIYGFELLCYFLIQFYEPDVNTLNIDSKAKVQRRIV